MINLELKYGWWIKMIIMGIIRGESLILRIFG
jgi:hypothetical protein